MIERFRIFLEELSVHLADAEHERDFMFMLNYPLSEYLPTLHQDALVKLYRGCRMDEPFVQLSPKTFKQLTDECVIRSLIHNPRDMTLLSEVLSHEYYSTDALTHAIPHLEQLISAENQLWLDKEILLINELQSLETQKTQFASVLQRVIYHFRHPERNRHFVTTLVVIDNQEGSELEPDFRPLLLDAFARRVGTYGTKAELSVFPDDETVVSPEFEDTASQVQKALQQAGLCKDIIEYRFQDELTFRPLFTISGQSAGLSLAQLAYAAAHGMPHPLSSYIAFCGSFEEPASVSKVRSKTINAKIEAAKDTGIRWLFLPDNNREDIKREHPELELEFTPQHTASPTPSNYFKKN